MSKKLYFIMGTAFLISSGFIYAIERLTYYIHWYLWMGKQMMDIPKPGTNYFIIVFAVIGLLFFTLDSKKGIAT